MDKKEFNSDWIDRYVRDELSEEDTLAFETALFDSPELQRELESALAIRQVFELENQSGDRSQPQFAVTQSRWQPLALAASVVLALFSTTMYWKVSNEVGSLQSEIERLNQPRGVSLVVPVNVMRSGGPHTPDVIVQKPGAGAAVVLDIELSSAVNALSQLNMSLVDGQGVELFSWVSSKTPSGRSQVVFDSSQLPDGLIWLEISDSQKQTVDKRLLEFLPGEL